MTVRQTASLSIGLENGGLTRSHIFDAIQAVKYAPLLLWMLIALFLGACSTAANRREVYAPKKRAHFAETWVDWESSRRPNQTFPIIE